MTFTTLITGASSGLGAEMARQFAALGHDLALTARRTDRLDELKAQILADHPGQQGGEAVPARLAGAVDAGRLSASVARRDGPAPAACTDPARRSDAAVPVPTGAMARTAAHGAAARAESVVCAGSQHARRVHDALAYAAGHDRAASAASACAAPRRAHGPRPVARRVDSRGASADGATGARSSGPGPDSCACASESLGPSVAHGPRAQRQHVLPPEAHDADGRCRGWQ